MFIFLTLSTVPRYQTLSTDINSGRNHNSALEKTQTSNSGLTPLGQLLKFDLKIPFCSNKLKTSIYVGYNLLIFNHNLILFQLLSFNSFLLIHLKSNKKPLQMLTHTFFMKNTLAK